LNPARPNIDRLISLTCSLPLHRTIAPLTRQPGPHRRFILTDAPREASQLGQATSFCTPHPIPQAVRRTATHQPGEFLHQCDGLPQIVAAGP
jgi:hypothetical protein